MSMPSRSSTGRGPLIAATLIVVSVLVLIAVLLMGGATLDGVWRSFFPPPAVTQQGREIRSLYDLVFYIAVAIFVIVEVVIVYTVFRYRRKPGDDTLPPQTHGNNLVEVIWTLIPTVIVAVLFFFSWQSLTKVDAVSASAPVQIRAVAARFQWQFDYLDANSQDPANDAPLFSQFLPQGEGGGMYVPVGVPVKVTLISPDVIHAFYVPQFLFKRDVVPGAANQFEFTVDQPGVYRGQCAELCGAFHGAMVFEVRAVDQAEFQTWLQDKIEGAPPASPSAPPSGEPPPSGQPPPSGEPPPSGAVTISAANASSFEQSAVQVPAGVAFTLTFDNKDVLPHNVAIRDASGAELFQGEIFTGPAKRDYQVPALPAGSYTFVCSVHPNMTGTLTAN
jgi:cytochrome c oxidase subunit 2